MALQIIKINGREESENGIFQAEVIFPSENRYDITIKHPFLEPGEIEANQEERLRWYFEEHSASPYTDTEKAKRAEKSIAFYGETLFNAVFADAHALAEWRDLANSNDKLRIQVYSDNASFQALHWEALKDPQETKACCLQGVEFIRTSSAPTPKLETQEASCLQLLLVTARPGGKDDIEYRTITRPIIETIEKNRMPVQAHLLRPPTFQALKDHLQEKKGVYHIVHFDVHGDVLSFPEYCKLMPGAGRNLIIKSFTGSRGGFSKEPLAAGGVKSTVLGRSGGRKEVTEYKGERAYISLLGENGGHDLVPAEDIADLLRDAHAPVCFLNACRSSKPTLEKAANNAAADETEILAAGASLAMRLLERGVHLVLGMAWSLTEKGAQDMMTKLYDSMTRGEAPGTALARARIAMFDDSCRFSLPDLRFELQDWLLPVVWGKGDFEITLQLKTPYPEERIALAARQGDFYPLYFVFANFYHQQPMPREAVDFMVGVLKKLDLYANKATDFLAQYGYVLGNLGSNYLAIKDYPAARNNLKKALALLQQAGKRQETGSFYHQLGTVAQEVGDLVEAQKNYLEALKIEQEFNDRYGQASTYHQLGNLAYEEKIMPQPWNTMPQPWKLICSIRMNTI